MLDDYDRTIPPVPPPAGCLRDALTVLAFAVLVVFVFGVLYQIGGR